MGCPYVPLVALFFEKKVLSFLYQATLSTSVATPPGAYEKISVAPSPSKSPGKNAAVRREAQTEPKNSE